MEVTKMTFREMTLVEKGRLRRWWLAMSTIPQAVERNRLPTLWTMVAVLGIAWVFEFIIWPHWPTH
jgi:hypothetical protein